MGPSHGVDPVPDMGANVFDRVLIPSPSVGASPVARCHNPSTEAASSMVQFFDRVLTDASSGPALQAAEQGGSTPQGDRG